MYIYIYTFILTYIHIYIPKPLLFLIYVSGLKSTSNILVPTYFTDNDSL